VGAVIAPAARTRDDLAGLLAAVRRPSVAVIGTFDGVHRGHRELVHNARRLAAARGLATIVLTMDPRPDVLLAPDRALPNVCTLDERIRRLRDAGADDVVVIPFTRETAALTYVEFCALPTEHLEMRSLYVGEDFALGRRRAGTPDRLRELGLDVWTNRASPTHTARARRAPRTSAGRSPSAPMRTSRSPQPDRTTITARRNGSC